MRPLDGWMGGERGGEDVGCQGAKGEKRGRE